MNPEQIRNKNLAIQAFELVKHRLPTKDAEDAYNYILEHNEWGIGMEHIITTIIECGIKISQQENEAIEHACQSTGIILHSKLKII